MHLVAVMRAVGTLGGPKATSIVESFSGDDPDDRIHRTANDALKNLHEQKQLVPAEIIYLRETLNELKKETEKLKNEL